jgi:hypothetical protein
MESGIVPYRIIKPNCDPWSIDGTLDVFGVYTWLQRPDGESLAGIVVQRLMDHQAWSVALLSYPYRPIDTYPRGHDPLLTLHHEGVFHGNTGKQWYYHRQEPSMVLLDPVPPKRIRVERIWDLGVCLVGHTIEERS